MISKGGNYPGTGLASRRTATPKKEFAFNLPPPHPAMLKREREKERERGTKSEAE